MKQKNNTTRRRGMVTVLVLVVVTVTAIILAAATRGQLLAQQRARQSVHRRQAAELAEAGLLLAQAKLRQNPAYTGEVWEPQGPTQNTETPNQSRAASAGQLAIEDTEGQADVLRVEITVKSGPDPGSQEIVSRAEFSPQRSPFSYAHSASRVLSTPAVVVEETPFGPGTAP